VRGTNKNMAIQPPLQNTDINNLLLQPNAFAKCAPNISTNIKECGSVTICNARPMIQSELANYTRTGDYLIMGAIIKHDMEIKMCDTVQNGLYDFLMANRINLSKKVQSHAVDSGTHEIAPFVMARQYSAINNGYWQVQNGAASGSNWSVDVSSTTNIPADVRSFPVGQRVYITGLTAAGTKTMTAWQIFTSVPSAVVTNGVTLVLTPQNAGSYLSGSRLQSPVTGLLTRGTNNVSDFENFCAEPPAYMNWKNVPFWTETQRTSLCRSTQYEKWRKALLEDNPLYREFGDLTEIEKNRQLGADWQKRLVETMFWGKKINANQTLANYNQLPQISAYDGSAFGLGVDGGTCVGYRANMTGVYEQLAECNRVLDLQGAQLNLIALFNEIYNMMRTREGASGKYMKTFDLFTDNQTAHAINQAMISYYNNEVGGTARFVVPIGGPGQMPNASFNKEQDIQKAEFGFNYRSYNLMYPAQVRINVITHYFFDDYLTANNVANQSNAGRLLLVLDFTNIYPGITTSNRKVWDTGMLKNLAAINSGFNCVMEVNTLQTTLMSVTGTMIVECPAGNLWLENFSNAIPAYTNPGNIVYPSTVGSGTTTTTVPA
jgi:hypothetical protein